MRSKAGSKPSKHRGVEGVDGGSVRKFLAAGEFGVATGGGGNGRKERLGCKQVR